MIWCSFLDKQNFKIVLLLIWKATVSAKFNGKIAPVPWSWSLKRSHGEIIFLNLENTDKIDSLLIYCLSKAKFCRRNVKLTSGNEKGFFQFLLFFGFFFQPWWAVVKRKINQNWHAHRPPEITTECKLWHFIDQPDATSRPNRRRIFNLINGDWVRVSWPDWGRRPPKRGASRPNTDSIKHFTEVDKKTEACQVLQ